jgi:RsiW-degrading membrane proteinase PrsW (M82 family)/ribosomal protein L32
MLRRLVPTNLRESVERPRGVLAVGAALIVFSLLANSAGLAIFIAALVVPIAIMIDLARRDLVEAEPWWAPLLMGVFGAVAALFVTLSNILLLKQFEDEADPVKTCCGVFLGRVNLDVRHVGALSVITVGFILPIVAEILKAAGPLYLRQEARFQNEVMDGITLGAAAGGGYAAAAAIVYFWPFVNGSPNLGGSVSGWTASLIALVVVRPIISCATTGLICAGIWRFGMQPQPAALVIPVASALGSTVVLAVGSLVIADQATVVELIWNIAVLLALLAASRYVVSQALAYDRRSLPATTDRVICPTCGKPTRAGTFCANCGAPLAPAAAPTVQEPIEIVPQAAKVTESPGEGPADPIEPTT